MSEHTSLDARHTSLGLTDEPVANVRPGWATAGRVKAVVLTAVFLLLAGSVFVDHTDPIFGLAVAIAWTALLALAWELAARTLARVRA